MTQIALVTGANRGIGYEVCKQLAEKSYTVLLCARDPQKGQFAASQALREDGLTLLPRQLDVTDTASIEALHDSITAEFGHLDVLINNAAILYDTFQRASTADLNLVREALETNLYGAWAMIQVFLPLMRKSDHPRIVNVSSGSGAFDEMGATTPAYSTSKVALNALTVMLDAELQREGFLTNAVCPGWVATDMGGAGGRPVHDGAAGIVWAATLPDDGPTGSFFRDTKRIDW